ncbi:MAG: hypothetical protein DUD27_06605 [Lachnospiraceae bacterium]|uniref:Preprotein translocase subunit SecY n=1 Tax=Candidatus Weimeria bifida TaxID=2599074 RepID=A0A6N7IWI2_9FIRM|nr:hypothetical protein [Candidatus Weimeria bifida]RRF96056.1 MAG: hypothetical protein DUD27_06605 [Lachnospiraceae bacterium]
MKLENKHELYKRIFFTFFMLAIYVAGKSIVLYGVAGDEAQQTGVQSYITSFFSGDRYQKTVMALGVMPYINASLLVQVISALKSANSRAKISKQKQDRWMLIAAVIISGLMAVAQATSFTYRSDAGPKILVMIIAALELFGGAMLTFYLCSANEKHGIGASMPIIMFNVITTLAETLQLNHFWHYPFMFVIIAFVTAGTIFLENSIIKIPLQRVSIHNIHADQNYMAYKRNPVGVLPVMFATAAFLVPQYFVRLLVFIFPKNKTLSNILDGMVLTRPLGVKIYLIIVFLLTIIFSFIMLNPMESAHQLQKNGDSIVGVYAGKDTRRLLVKIVVKWSIISGILQTGCMALFLIMSLEKVIPVALAMLPSSAMILVSIICTFVQETGTYYRYDAYSFFM